MSGNEAWNRNVERHDVELCSVLGSTKLWTQLQFFYIASVDQLVVSDVPTFSCDGHKRPLP